MQIKDSNKNRNRIIGLGLVCFLLQVMVSPNVGMGNGRINFALVFCGVYALREGGQRAVVAGFVAGLLFDLLSTGPIGLMAALLTLFSYFLGLEGRNRFADGLVSSLSTFGVASLVVVLVYHMSMNLLGASDSFFDLLFQRTLPTFALTFVAFLPFAYQYVHGASRAHGLGSGGTPSSKRGGHYDVSNL